MSQVFTYINTVYTVYTVYRLNTADNPNVP